MRPPLSHFLSLCSLSLLLLGSPTVRAAELTVSAASSLSTAFKEISSAFESLHPGTRVLLNTGASDALLAQISKGAPVDVFASADQETMDRAESLKAVVPGSRRNFVSNRLVLIAPAGGSPGLRTLQDLRLPAVQRVAMGRPEGVPAGRYAKGALDLAGLWPYVEPKAVYASHVRQALDYVARGEVEAGFVYASDAAQRQGQVRVVTEVPTASSIRYPVALVSGGSNAEAGRRFIDYLLSPAGQSVLAKHGFVGL